MLENATLDPIYFNALFAWNITLVAGIGIRRRIFKINPCSFILFRCTLNTYLLAGGLHVARLLDIADSEFFAASQPPAPDYALRLLPHRQRHIGGFQR